ncbi:MAG: metal ABC transporter permease [Ardenticatenia bacterium]|nr:metal ABC transporter permease [Ardenticatenia bacterium]
MSAVEWLILPWRYPFFVHAVIAATLVGLVGGVVGSYVVLRGMAFFGDALAHAILPGLAVAYLLVGARGEGLFWGGLVAALVAALLIARLSAGRQVSEDTAIGITFAGMFALGIAMISTGRTFAVDLTHILFGNVLAVSRADLVRMGVVGGGVVLAVVWYYREFLILAFDPLLAATLKLPVGRLNDIFVVLIALSVVVSLQTVGTALTLAMLITPAATAQLLAHRLSTMMALAVAVGIMAGLIGLYVSFYFSVASGAAIVLTATLLFGGVWVWRGRA